jgi:acetyl esterase/lipase
MMPWKRWLSLRAYGLVTSTLFRARTPPTTMRARFDRFAVTSRTAMQHRFPDLVFGDHRAGHLAIESMCAVRSPSCAIVHLHGGAFVMGSPRSYRERVKRLSHHCRAEVFVPDYRLAPEHPYPAALDDALAAVHYVTTHRPGVPIFITGDSCGGGLALSILLRLRSRGLPMPSGVIALSPWTDLTASGASIETNRRKDLWLTREHLDVWARYYVGNADPRDAELSPLFGDLSRLPPLLLLVGENEILLDDSLRMAERAAQAGTEARVHVGQGMQHDWPLTLPWLGESRLAWAEMRQFVERHLHTVAPKNPDVRKCGVKGTG